MMQWGDLETSIYETAWYLTGMEKFLMDMMIESEYVEPLLNKIMYVNTEIGLDILNPIQPLAKDMTPENLSREFGKDLVFFGGIDVQDLLPNRSPDEITEEVKRVAGILTKKGHYIIAPAHNIQDDTPVENILAFFKAVKEL